MEHGQYDDRFFGVSRYPVRPHLLRGGGMGKEVYDLREDIADSLTEVAWEIDKGTGHGGISGSDLTPSTNISGGTDNQFGISVNGDAVEQVILANVTTLNTAALIVAAINAALAKLTGTDNSSAKAYYYGGRYIIVGPYDPDDPAAASVVISDGLANNVADDLKIGLANGGGEFTGSLSDAIDALAGTGPNPSAFGTAAFLDANATVAVAFATPQPDANYRVAHTPVENTAGLANVVCWVDSKTVNGFNLNISAAPGVGFQVDVDWAALR